MKTWVLPSLLVFAACTSSGGETEQSDAFDDVDSVTSALSTGTLRSNASSALSLVGAAVDPGMLASVPSYRTVLAREYNQLTPENAMKWGPIHPGPSTYAFGDADAIVTFAQQNGQQVRGHTLVWHVGLPAWVTALSGAALRQSMRDHIAAVVGRYRGRVAQWDVVNEAIDDNGALRSTAFSTAMGRGFIAEAFHAARAADPAALLGYNDYGIEVPGPKQNAVVGLVSELRGASVPIGYVGIQMHLNAYEFATGRLNTSALRASIQRFGALGVRVYITELDLRVDGLSGTAASRADIQRRAYHQVATACRAEPSCAGVTTWGFTDARTWLPAGSSPLPFDASYAPKPAYTGLRDGVAGVAAPAIAMPWASACGTTVTNAAFCDPIESDTLAMGRAVRELGTLTAAPHRYRGNMSVRALAQSAAVTRRAYISRDVWHGLASGELWTRSHVYLNGTSTGPATLLAIDAQTGDKRGIGFGVAANGRAQLLVATAQSYPTATTLFPKNRWACIEMRVVVGRAGRAELYVDGTRVVTASPVDTLPPGGLGALKFGIARADAGGGLVDVFFDDVAASRTRLGCN